MNTQTEPRPILEQFTVMERAIIYARVSTDEQAESGTSIDNQVEKSLAYAAAHNINVVAIFKEDYTDKVLGRPELNKVRDMLRAGLADNVIVYKTNRLDRSEWGLNLLILLQELKQLGVSLHYSQSGRRVDLSNPVEALMQPIEGWQAGEDHRETVTKLHEGRLKRAKDGYVVPNGKDAPFGYRKVKIDKRWYFEIVEAEAAIVRLIFQWYVFGDETGQPLSLAKVTDKLNEMGISRRDNPKWAFQTVHHIIASETYAGVWYYGKRNRDNRTHTTGAIPVTVPAIIEREVWEAAQERLQENRAYSERNRKPGRYLLANRVTCGECHYKMMGQAKRWRGCEYFYYRCPASMGHKFGRQRECHQPSFRVDVVDRKVWDRLEEVSKDRDLLVEGLRGYQARQESKTEPIKRELSYVEQLIKDKTAEWEDDLVNLKVLTSERAKARKAVDIAQLESILDELEKRKVDLLAQLEEKSLTNEQIISLAAFAEQVADDMATLREAEAKGLDNPELRLAVYEEKRRLLAALDVQVTLFVEDGRKKARITTKYCPDGDALSVASVGICSNAPASG
ncbi:MAG: recombinase family protein [Chloroflexi bacterium]|nr:recombinase family protein [Chloroflexota bacterium]